MLLSNVTDSIEIKLENLGVKETVENVEDVAKNENGLDLEAAFESDEN